MTEEEARLRHEIAAEIRAAAPKYLDNEVDVHTWRVLDDLAGKVEGAVEDN